MFEDIFEFNVNLFKVQRQKKQLQAKYKHVVNLYSNSLDLLSLASKYQLSESEFREILKNAPDEIACMYCTAAITTNKTQQLAKYFDIMIQKVMNDSDLLFYCLFHSSGYYIYNIVYRAYTFKLTDNERAELLNRKNYLGPLYPYISQIFLSNNYYLFSQARKKYIFMIIFFLLFYPYFTYDMFNTLAYKVIKPYAKKIDKYPDNQYFIKYLSSNYIQDFPFKNELDSILLLYKLK